MEDQFELGWQLQTQIYIIQSLYPPGWRYRATNPDLYHTVPLSPRLKVQSYKPRFISQSLYPPGWRYRATNPDLYHYWSFPWTNPTPGYINGFSILSGKKVRINFLQTINTFKCCNSRSHFLYVIVKFKFLRIFL